MAESPDPIDSIEDHSDELFLSKLGDHDSVYITLQRDRYKHGATLRKTPGGFELEVKVDVHDSFFMKGKDELTVTIQYDGSGTPLSGTVKYKTDRPSGTPFTNFWVGVWEGEDPKVADLPEHLWFYSNHFRFLMQ